MIFKYTSVLLLYIIFIIRFCFGTSNNLEFLFIANLDVIRCSTYEYLIIDNWFKLISSNISCPNQAELFPEHPPDIYKWSLVSVACSEVNKTFSIYSHLTDFLPTSATKNKKLIKDRYKLMRGTMDADNRNYPFEAVITKNQSTVSVDQGSLKWSSNGNNTYILYMTFTEQPIMCRIIMNLTEMMKNQICANQSGKRDILCYYEPLSKSISPETKVDWTQLDFFINDQTYPPNNWQDKGGYYLDVRLLNKITTSVNY